MTKRTISSIIFYAFKKIYL